jgi:hypothetical protein
VLDSLAYRREFDDLVAVRETVTRLRAALVYGAHAADGGAKIRAALTLAEEQLQQLGHGKKEAAPLVLAAVKKWEGDAVEPAVELEAKAEGHGMRVERPVAEAAGAKDEYWAFQPTKAVAVGLHCADHCRGSTRQAKLHRILWKDRPMKVRCDQCGIRFRASYHLVRHTQAVHDRVKNYQCDKPECGRRFGWLAGLQAHRIRGHGERGAHACTSCTVSYATPSLLAQHVSRIHQREKRCKCGEPGCGAAFVWMSDLLAHRRRLHGLAKLHCAVPGCPRTKGFLWQTALYRHNTTFHQG